MQNDETHHFQQRRTLILQIVALLSALLALVILALIVGPGLEPPWQSVVIPVATLSLCAVLAAFVWMLLKGPTVLRIGPDGIDLPIVFKQPLSWSDIHRIRRSSQRSGLYGTRTWLVVDPSPGVLAPLRLPVWRWLELKFQKYHGVRIPLHGIDAPEATIIASIERFRPVESDDD